MNAQFLINGQAGYCLTPMDRGFAYGDGVFRTLPVKAGVPQCWPLHYAKLRHDGAALGIACPSEEEWLQDIAVLCREQTDAAVKLVLTRGEGMRGYAVPALPQPCRVVSRAPLPVYPQSNYAAGVALYLCATRLSWQPRLAGIKHLNRLENVLARMEWGVADGFADGLLCDMEGNVVECVASNVFVRRGNRLLTPDLSVCGVAGVTRQRIIELLPELGYEVTIGRFDLDFLLECEEVLICNSLIGVWQVCKAGDHAWPVLPLAALLRDRLESMA